MRCSATLAALVAAVAAPGVSRGEAGVSADVPVSLERLRSPAAGPRRGFVRPTEATPSRITTPALALARPTLYLNGKGGAYTGGNDDSTINRSSVIAYYRTSGGTLSPFPYPDELWRAVVACVEERYAPFGVTVTDEDPGDAPHLEIAVAGRPEEIGLPPGCCLGVAPFACAPIENAVSYAFAGVHPESVEDLCWTVLQESAHTLGLDHELLCADPMTYLSECGPRKVFTDESAPCGEDAPRDCMCSDGGTQSSAARLREVLGDGPDETTPADPEVDGTAGADEGGRFGCTAAPGRDPEAGLLALAGALAAALLVRLTGGRPRRLPSRTSRSAGRASRSRPR